MSLSVAVSPFNQSKLAEGQFVADLSSLLERSGVAAGDVAQLADLLRSSAGFRGRLFTLCTAISHMSDHDLSGDELLDLLSRSLGMPDTREIPDDVVSLFLSGLEAWNNRSALQHDEWPPFKKPSASESVAPSQQNGVPLRPAGVRTLQEALGFAHSSKDLNSQAEVALPYRDVNSLAIQDLNALLGEIEDRMKRLQPQVTGELMPAALLNPAAREAAFLERHSYLNGKRSPASIDQLANPVRINEPVELPIHVEEDHPAPALPEADQELRLVPRNVMEDLPVAPRRPNVPDSVQLKTWLALAVVICIALVATPFCAVVAYRYMHPLYIYAPAAPTTEQVPAEPAADKSGKKSSPSSKHATRRTKPQRPEQPPPFQVFPAQ
jgi:hypothetical protein